MSKDVYDIYVWNLVWKYSNSFKDLQEKFSLKRNLLLLLLEALQLKRSFGLLNEFLPLGPVSDAVLPVCYFHHCYIALYIILPSIFRSS